MNSTKWIARLSAIAVFLLALGGFILSYSALYEVAQQNGVPTQLAWIWPLLIDLSLVIFSLAVVRAALLSERQWWPWALVVLFTLATIAFNTIHAGNTNEPFGIPLKYLVGIVPPIALVLGFETFMGMIRSGVQRGQLANSLVNLRLELDNLNSQWDNEQDKIEAGRGQLQGQLDTLNKQIEQAKRTIDQLNDEAKQKRDELERGAIKVYLPDNLTPDGRQQVVHKMANDQLTIGQMAELLGVSEGTIKNDKRAIRVNGNGK